MDAFVKQYMKINSNKNEFQLIEQRQVNSLNQKKVRSLLVILAYVFLKTFLSHQVMLS